MRFTTNADLLEINIQLQIALEITLFFKLEPFSVLTLQNSSFNTKLYFKK